MSDFKAFNKATIMEAGYEYEPTKILNLFQKYLLLAKQMFSSKNNINVHLKLEIINISQIKDK